MLQHGSKVVFFLTTLHDDGLRDAYEQWVRDVDTPSALALRGVLAYRVIRLEDSVTPDTERPTYSYIEVLEVSDLGLYQASLTSLPQQFHEQFRSFIGPCEAVSGQVIN